jgi:fatty-acyl-CoA synthase
MAALVLRDGVEFSPEGFIGFLSEQPDLGPKQWPSFVRIGTNLPRTETFKVIKRLLSAEGTDCTDAVYPIRTP